MLQINEQTLFHFLLFEGHFKESVSQLLNKLLWGLSYIFHQLNLVETLKFPLRKNTPQIPWRETQGTPKMRVSRKADT